MWTELDGSWSTIESTSSIGMVASPWTIVNFCARRETKGDDEGRERVQTNYVDVSNLLAHRASGADSPVLISWRLYLTLENKAHPRPALNSYRSIRRRVCTSQMAL